MANYLFDSAAIEWRPHPRFEGAFVKPLITSEMNSSLTLSRVKLQPGGELPPHTHEASTETFYVLSGEAYCRVGEEEATLKAGHYGYAPPGVSHTVRNTGQEDLHAISIFNPPLEQR